MTGDVLGAVLAGGRGRRIGGDKPLLEIGGWTLVRRAVDALRSVGLDVALVLRPRQPVPFTAHTVAILRDEIEDAGPLGGLQTLLRRLPVEWALVVPCDQPLLQPDLLRGLVSEPREDVDTVVGRPAALPEPLPGLYRRACLDAVEGALSRGERSLRDLLASLRVRELPVEALRRWDSPLLSYLNVNTPADLARARSFATSTDGQSCVSRELLSHRR